ncbi:MAG: transcription antitermination factor NusB [Mycoplasmatales bacterium]
MKRRIIYNLLLDYYKNQTFLNLKLKELEADEKAQALYSYIIYGIIEYDLYLDYIINEITRDKLNLKVRTLLKMAIFEYRYVNSIPNYATKNEIIELTKKVNYGDFKYVTYLLGQITDEIINREPTFTNVEKNLAIKYSFPKWIVSSLIAQYPEEFEQILIASHERKKVYVRKLTEFSNPSDFKLVTENEKLYEFIGKNIVKHPDFVNKHCTIQDFGSYLVGTTVAAQSTEVILDLCAAPGSKTLQIAETAKSVVANELHDVRARKLVERIKENNLENVEVICADATDFELLRESLSTKALPDLFDKVLIDAPCSGWGVINTKPEIKYNHTKADVDKLVETQLEILHSGIKFVKKGGKLIYSTCTLNKVENEQQIKKILEENSSLQLIYERTLMPFEKASSGFYIAVLEKNV